MYRQINKAQYQQMRRIKDIEQIFARGAHVPAGIVIEKDKYHSKESAVSAVAYDERNDRDGYRGIIREI